MFESHYHYTPDDLKQSISIIKQYFTLTLYSPMRIFVNISYSSTSNQSDGYLDANISPKSIKLYCLNIQGNK